VVLHNRYTLSGDSLIQELRSSIIKGLVYLDSFEPCCWRKSDLWKLDWALGDSGRFGSLSWWNL